MRKTPHRREIVQGLGLAMAGALALPPAVAQDRRQKILLVYHSRTGHTRTVAEMIQGRTGGDLVEIKTVDPYPENYDALVARNVEDQRSGFLPPLRTRLDNIGDYDIVIVGSPLWNVRLTPPTRSFLSSHRLAGKTIAPFVTYIVSGLGRARQDIAELAPEARILDGLAVLGEQAPQATSAVTSWLGAVQGSR